MWLKVFINFEYLCFWLSDPLSMWPCSKMKLTQTVEFYKRICNKNRINKKNFSLNWQDGSPYSDIKLNRSFCRL